MPMLKAFPWTLSFLLHAALVIVPLRLAVTPATEGTREPRIEVFLESGAGFGQGSHSEAVHLNAITGGRATGMPVPRISDRGIPLTALRMDMSDVRPISPTRELPQAGTITDTDLFPRPQDILADIPGSDESAQELPQSTESIRASENPALQAERIGWEGQGRKLIRRRDPGFPQALSASGQEVECEARIVVAPNGNVVHVEITKSSGYTEVDASVESALRDYLFSRGDTRKEAVGTIRFRFRLEKRD